MFREAEENFNEEFRSPGKNNKNKEPLVYQKFKDKYIKTNFKSQ